MSKEEFKALLEKLGDADTAPEATVALLDYWEEVTNGHQDLEDKLANSLRRISELQGVAARLAQRVTGGGTGGTGRDEGGENHEPTEEELEAEGRAFFVNFGKEGD